MRFVTRCIILLEVAIRSREDAAIKGFMWSATILRCAVAFKRRSFTVEGSNVHQQNILHTITPSPDGSQDPSLFLITPKFDPIIFLSRQCESQLIFYLFFNIQLFPQWLQFSVLTTFSADCWWEHPRRSAVSEILNRPRLAPTIFPESLSHRSRFFPNVMFEQLLVMLQTSIQ